MEKSSLRTRFLLWSLLAEALLFGGGALFWLRALADPLAAAHQPSTLVPGIALLATLLLALAAVQWSLLGRLTAPVQHLAARIGQVEFNERLSPADVPGELTSLVEGFNATLDRLEQTVVRTMQFSAVASHELRTPLTVLRGEIEIALRHSTLDEEMRSLLVSNLEEISRMSRIIEDLLLLSKSDIGEIPLRLESLELNELLTDLFAQAAVLGEEKDIAVRYYPSPEQIMFQGDSLRLRQLFLNLLSNAIKYTPAGGAVDMTLVSEGGDALISVKDTGIGIGAEHLAHIFERFYRVDKLENQGDGGSGLGLSIAEWVVEAHGGEIKVNSVVGEGTEFIVKLPLSRS
ncbi:MAG: ATP-binding protein [Desulfuromonadales bacterium]|nr:ATP-binding protein [Desulfuromonadales bacterium]